MESVLYPSWLSLFFSFCCSGPCGLRNTHIQVVGWQEKTQDQSQELQSPFWLILFLCHSIHQASLLCEPSTAPEPSGLRQMRREDRGHPWVHLPFWPLLSWSWGLRIEGPSGQLAHQIPLFLHLGNGSSLHTASHTSHIVLSLIPKYLLNVEDWAR